MVLTVIVFDIGHIRRHDDMVIVLVVEDTRHEPKSNDRIIKKNIKSYNLKFGQYLFTNTFMRPFPFPMKYSRLCILVIMYILRIHLTGLTFSIEA